MGTLRVTLDVPIRTALVDGANDTLSGVRGDSRPIGNDWLAWLENRRIYDKPSRLVSREWLPEPKVLSPELQAAVLDAWDEWARRRMRGISSKNFGSWLDSEPAGRDRAQAWDELLTSDWEHLVNHDWWDRRTLVAWLANPTVPKPAGDQ